MFIKFSELEFEYRVLKRFLDVMSSFLILNLLFLERASFLRAEMVFSSYRAVIDLKEASLVSKSMFPEKF